ncbi:MAG: FdhF/YdeP family oxidoreductase [Actinomycetota bacterium]
MPSSPRVRRRTKDWVGPIPYGIGEVKPNHYGEMARIAWENRDHPLYAWRILRDGVCDGCALGTTGLHDFTMDGVHLCTVRLNLLRLNTMDAMDSSLLHDVRRVEGLSSKEMRDLGRLPYPMLRRRGEPGFARIPWSEALGLLGQTLRRTPGERMGFYLTSRGITNEVYYVAQKAARFLGTNNVDNSARLCHAPSTVAMKQMLGVGASTCSYTDWIGADLIVFIGSDVANNQPVTTKYLYYAKRKGTRVAVVNPYAEPGMRRYWVPSVAESALFGTKICDEFYPVHTGGDLAFFNGVLKHLLEQDWIDRAFVSQHTRGFEEAAATVRAQPWESLQASAGASREDMLRFARMLSGARNTIFVWSMGATQHAHGVDTVRAILNVALARGAIGRPHAGVMPIRGHSGVQGGAEVGCAPGIFPGLRPVNAESAREMESLWGFAPPSSPGLTAADQIDAAHAGALDVLWSAGGNFLETLPEPDFVREALERIPHRVHQDIVATSQMLVPPKEWALILPARTRYEQRGGGTETTTERQIVYSPEIPGPRPGEARSEWEIFMHAASAARPDRAALIRFDSGAAIRAEIARAVPFYAGIERLARKGDHVQWGGRLLCEGGAFQTPDGRARFAGVAPPESRLSDGAFLLSTRRGKQFNSMIHRARDPLTGAGREDVFVARGDADRLGLAHGDPVLVRSAEGSYRGRVKIAAIRPRNVQVHWPESQALLARGRRDPECGVPDYNAVVTLEPSP